MKIKFIDLIEHDVIVIFDTDNEAKAFMDWIHNKKEEWEKYYEQRTGK